MLQLFAEGSSKPSSKSARCITSAVTSWSLWPSPSRCRVQFCRWIGWSVDHGSTPCSKPILGLLTDGWNLGSGLNGTHGFNPGNSVLNAVEAVDRRFWQLLRCHLWSWLAQWTSNGSSVTAGRWQYAISVIPSSSMRSPIRNPGESQLTGCWAAEKLLAWGKNSGQDTPEYGSTGHIRVPHLSEFVSQSTTPLAQETKKSAHRHACFRALLDLIRTFWKKLIHTASRCIENFDRNFDREKKGFDAEKSWGRIRQRNSVARCWH